MIVPSELLIIGCSDRAGEVIVIGLPGSLSRQYWQLEVARMLQYNFRLLQSQQLKKQGLRNEGLLFPSEISPSPLHGCLSVT